MEIAFLAESPFCDKIMKGICEGGLYNGYVAFDKELPLSYKGALDFEIENPLDYLVEVHGGITFDKSDAKKMAKKRQIIPLTAIPDPEIFHKMRVIGFDTFHDEDTKEQWNFEAVKKETLNLLKQIEKL